jgi:PST family polysaccharide transporter
VQTHTPENLQAAAGDKDLYFQTEHLEADLKGRAARGGAVTLVSQTLKFVLSMVVTVILARLLTPQDYGLIGMVVVVTGFITLFKDIGLASATIQRAEINHQQISTLFWINVGLSILTMLVTIAIAPLVARFYGEPRLTGITMVFAAGFLFGGLTVQHEALLRRQMRFVALSVIDILSLLAAPMVSIIMARRGYGYWALVFGQLATAVTNAVGVWVVCGWRPGRPSRNAGVRSMLAFGGNLTGFGVVNFFARSLDNILIGRFWGATQLGLYARAYQLLILPIEQINAPITAVAMPTLSRMVDSPERYRKAYVRMLEKVAILTMPGVALMIATSEWVVRLLLGPQWMDTAYIYRLLGITALIQPIANTTGWLFISQDRTRDMLRWGMISGFAMMAAIVAGLRWGAVGVAASYSIVSVCTYPGLFWFVGRKGPVRAREFYSALAPAACAALSILVALFFLRRWLGDVKPLVGLAISSAVALGVTLLTLAVLPAGRAVLLDLKNTALLLKKRGSLAKET